MDGGCEQKLRTSRHSHALLWISCLHSDAERAGRLGGMRLINVLVWRWRLTTNLHKNMSMSDINHSMGLFGIGRCKMGGWVNV